MKIASLIALLLVGAAAFAGWYLYNEGIVFPNLSVGHNHPVVVADEATGYSQAQLEQAAHTMPDIKTTGAPHDYGSDKSYVPPEVNYIRIEYLASVVEKPFPKVFIADQAFPYNFWILESVLVVNKSRMQKVLTRADDLACSPNSNVMDIRENQVEVLLRSAHRPLRRCLINRKAGCRYLHSLRQIPPSDLMGDASLPIDEMQNLEKQMSCPTKPFIF